MEFQRVMRILNNPFPTKMGISRSPLPQNNGNLSLTFFGGHFATVILDNIY